MFKNITSRRNRILLRELVVTDFKLRYQGSVLGYLWSVLKPLFLFAILYVVFDYVFGLGKGVPHYPVYLLLGMVLWTFFTEATINGLQSVVSRGDLIRKINFPKYIIVVSGTISAFINLIFNLVVVGVFIVLNGVVITWHVLFIIPLIIELYIFGLAIAFFLSALNVKFRDIGYLWEIFIQAAFYATPILYPISMVIEKSEVFARLLLLNPVAQIIQDARWSVVSPTATTIWSYVGGWKTIIPFLIIGSVLLLASYYFRHNSKNFAEQI